MSAVRPCDACGTPLAPEPDGTWFCARCAAPSSLSNLGSFFGGGWGLLCMAGWLVAPVALAAGALAGWLFWSFCIHELVREGFGGRLEVVWSGSVGFLFELAYAIGTGKALWHRLARDGGSWFPVAWVAAVGLLPVGVVFLMLACHVIR